jgi:hypothetical protein
MAIVQRTKRLATAAPVVPDEPSIALTAWS